MNRKILTFFVSLILAAALAILVYRFLAGHKHEHDIAAPQESFKIDAVRPQSSFDNVKRELAAGNAESAITGIESFISRNPSSPQLETAYILLGTAYEKNGDILKAKDAYQKVMEKFPASAGIVKAQEALDNVNMKILFSRVATKDSFIYEVNKGDSLVRLAKKFNTTKELITRANDLKDSNVRTGQRLKVTKSKFSIVVDKSQNILMLKSDNDIVKTYRVSTGKNSSTPTGTFKITTRIVNPTWYTGKTAIPPGDPRNILGSRWLGISEKGYGIHGTTEPQSLGKSVTAGCVRMANPDVEELYTVIPEGTEVIIID